MVELLVAMSGGLMLTVTVFTLAKYATSMYQGETHMAGATMANVIGFERLRSDIGRAALMSSPNIVNDPFKCGSPASGGWPTQLKDMTSLTITPTPLTSLPAVIGNNGLAPQSLILSGNYSTDEAFPLSSHSMSGSNFAFALEVRRAQLVRLGYFEDGVDRAALLATAFPAGRAARVSDDAGRYHYGTILAVDTTARPTVILKDGSPDLIYRDGSALGCGLRFGSSTGTINAVNFVRYQIRPMTALEKANYAPLFDGTGPTYDAGRTELIREELDTSGVVIPNTTELIAEYAVDLRFALTVAPSLTAPLSYVEPLNVGGWAGPPGTWGAGQGPQLVRAVHATLSVRSREADRAGPIAHGSGPMFRMGLGSGGSTPAAPFARVRTSQARITLNNQLGANWQ
jgi:hypothetical protein